MSEHPDTCKGRALAMRERLQQAFPRAFPRGFKGWRALAVGIRATIAERLELTEPRDLAALSAALAAHAKALPYLRAVAKGGKRVNLEGKPAGDITDAERAQAAERIKARAAKPAPAKASKPRKPTAPTGKPTPSAAPVVIRKRRKLETAQKPIGAAKG